MAGEAGQGVSGEYCELMADYDNIRVDRDRTVVTVTLSNPAKRNVLSRVTLDELTDAFETIASGDTLGVILAADGPVFSAGHNFADMLGVSESEARELFDVCTNMMTLIQRMPQVVLAKVHALATAAGCQLVATCDLAVAAESASFAAPGGKGGLFCHTPMVAISRAVGRKKGLEMALTGDRIDARTACDWGLVNRVVPDHELNDAACDLLAAATRGSPSGKAIGKLSYYAQVDLPTAEAYDFASAVMAAGVVATDGQEGIAGFVEKRRPVWMPRV